MHPSDFSDSSKLNDSSSSQQLRRRRPFTPDEQQRPYSAPASFQPLPTSQQSPASDHTSLSIRSSSTSTVSASSSDSLLPATQVPGNLSSPSSSAGSELASPSYCSFRTILNLIVAAVPTLIDCARTRSGVIKTAAALGGLGSGVGGMYGAEDILGFSKPASVAIGAVAIIVAGTISATMSNSNDTPVSFMHRMQQIKYQPNSISSSIANCFVGALSTTASIISGALALDSPLDAAQFFNIDPNIYVSIGLWSLGSLGTIGTFIANYGALINNLPALKEKFLHALKNPYSGELAVLAIAFIFSLTSAFIYGAATATSFNLNNPTSFVAILLGAGVAGEFAAFPLIVQWFTLIPNLIQQFRREAHETTGQYAMKVVVSVVVILIFWSINSFISAGAGLGLVKTIFDNKTFISWLQSHHQTIPDSKTIKMIGYCVGSAAAVFTSPAAMNGGIALSKWLTNKLSKVFFSLTPEEQAAAPLLLGQEISHYRYST